VVALPLSIYSGVKKIYTPTNKMEKYISVTLKVFMVLSFLWVPVCYLLAGNLSFNFSDKSTFQGGQWAMKIFWIFSYTLVAGPLILWVIFWINSFIKHITASSDK
jgi:hypothetical protein